MKTVQQHAAASSDNADEAGAGEASALRVMEVLNYLAQRAEPVSAAQIARECGMSRSSTYRVLRAMDRMNFAVHLEDERLWGIGIAAFEIGAGYLRSAPLERLARPLLVRLTNSCQQTAHLAVLHGADVLYLLKQTTAIPSRPFVTDIGVRLPAHLTVVGRALLSHLPAEQVRAVMASPAGLVSRTSVGPRRMSELSALLREDRLRGFSMETGSTTEDVSCIAAAVFDHHALPVASIGVSFHDALGETELEATIGGVRNAADELTRRLKGVVPGLGAAGPASVP